MDGYAIWQALFLFSAAAYWPSGVLLFSRMERLVPAGTRASAVPPISVIIPARDEAAALPGLLEALSSLDPPPFEVIVVDDRSADATAELARAGGARLVHSDGPPPGWTGKNRACQLGAQAAQGEMLLFLDADVRPGGAAALLSGLYLRWEQLSAGGSAGGTKGALVSVQPFHRMRRPYEKLSLFFNLVAIAGSRDFGVFRKGGRPAGAFGPCMFTDRESYRACGGHETVRGAVVDDIALARIYREAGFPVRSYIGGSALEFRMYPGGPAQLAEGWTKNMASGAGSAGGAVNLLLVFWVTGMVNAFLLLLSAGRGGAALLTGGAAFLAWAGQIFFFARRIGSFGPLSALMYPLHLLFFTALFLRSLFLTFVRGSVRWRGREIPIGRGPRA